MRGMVSKVLLIFIVARSVMYAGLETGCCWIEASGIKD